MSEISSEKSDMSVKNKELGLILNLLGEYDDVV